MWRSCAVAAGALAIALPAFAEIAPATQPLTLPPFRPGPVMTFKAEDRVLQTDTPTAPVGTGRSWTFDLQVLKAEPGGGAVVRYVLRSFESAGAYTKGDGFWSLVKDTPVELDVGPDGTPRDIVNFDAIKGPFVARYPAESAKAGLYDAVLVWMAAMQGRGPLAPGRTTLPAAPAIDDFHHVTQTIDFDGVDAGLCQAKVGRTTARTIDRVGAPPIVDALTSTAMVSTADGWLVSLDERTTGTLVIQHTVQRTSAAGCR